MADLVITCISDSEVFPKLVFDYLSEKLTEHGRKTKKRNQLEITPETVRLYANEIRVSDRSNVPKSLAKQVLESLLKSEPVAYQNYRVIEFGDTFTVGPVLPIDTLTCEFCGYFTQYEEDLYTHRMTHLAGF